LQPKWHLFSILTTSHAYHPTVPSEYQPQTGRLPAYAKALLETRIRRFIAPDGREWCVREAPLPKCEKRSGFCLIFEADGLARRVWSYPASWLDMPQTDLCALCDARPIRR
jgi:hypothetical protein